MLDRVNKYQKGYEDGYCRGKVAGILGTILVTSPLIVAGAIVLANKSTPSLREGLQKIRDTDLYTKYFNKDEYEKKNFEKTRSLYGQEEEI